MTIRKTCWEWSPSKKTDEKVKIELFLALAKELSIQPGDTLIGESGKAFRVLHTSSDEKRNQFVAVHVLDRNKSYLAPIVSCGLCNGTGRVSKIVEHWDGVGDLDQTILENCETCKGEGRNEAYI